jgi:hypothetical protein
MLFAIQVFIHMRQLVNDDWLVGPFHEQQHVCYDVICQLLSLFVIRFSRLIHLRVRSFIERYILFAFERFAVYDVLMVRLHLDHGPNRNFSFS